MKFRQNKSIYLQIADFIIESIIMNKWKECERIPSVRDMAVRIEVNPNTVLRTYTYLQEKEIIYNQRGIGYFVCNDAINKAISVAKKDFTHKELPKLFHTMNILKLNFTDIEKLYHEFINQNESHQQA